MMDKVSYQGGFVWSYLPDFSRQWGELEARRSMIWLQPPGTATVGHVLLDAYHATKDEYYYRAAEQVASAIMRAQLPSGGWNYVADFSGEDSLREWYSTVGKNAWRLEEFQYYSNNATFDDGGTMEAATFLLRLYLEKHNKKYRPALTKAIDFVLQSQYPIGGWPQRYPLSKSQPHKGVANYASFITFNDDVADKNLEFLLMCYQSLGETRVLGAIERGMNAYVLLQLKQPQPGWALQYNADLLPDGARSFEPKSVSTSTTLDNIYQLLKFYKLTGDKKFIARIPEALDWLETKKLPPEAIKNNRTYAGNVELGTGRFLFTHRRGSNVVNGEYYADYNPEKTLAHYGSARHIEIDALGAAYADVLGLSSDELAKQSPFKSLKRIPLPAYFSFKQGNNSDLNLRGRNSMDSERHLQEILTTLNSQGYWSTTLVMTSNPYRGEPPATGLSKDTRYAETMVGDEWDTSPYISEAPVEGISTGVYVKNMGALIRYLIDNKNL
ncbi:pectate lyase [Cellvibrio zantedeschiae]|uniref:Pectate lyase n=2 Tax=Cellvibrio zantedeschiae TaxID=1237077 RepID=A0ABQ3B9E4_9GAMM|nr:pectate lyase [Cellvibrio zantedeschiae]